MLPSLLALAITTPCAAAELFGFVDDNGVFNFSDANSDPRYRLLQGTKASPAIANQSVRTVRPSRELASMIHEAGQLAGVDPALIEAVASVESGFNARARSPKGALGLMQLMPETAQRMGVADPFDPRQNLIGGARHLRELLDRFKALHLVLAAYNAGSGAVEQHSNEIPPFRETLAYVPLVLQQYKALTSRTR